MELVAFSACCRGYSSLSRCVSSLRLLQAHLSRCILSLISRYSRSCDLNVVTVGTVLVLRAQITLLVSSQHLPLVDVVGRAKTSCAFSCIFF